ncbi:hypothetical protein BS47DRAFT_1354085 [Hydnum rufescens UP504]|uniref:Uncharacterized protein n=1 Tax=Hydnum rufescens UP504 TaxID=1448309 RepID=A0A9P6AHC1_9AGAM|nr:hypothetical protein BS47DRAFT_1354085 [Hydnum rufescens UP504]
MTACQCISKCKKGMLRQTTLRTIYTVQGIFMDARWGRSIWKYLSSAPTTPVEELRNNLPLISALEDPNSVFFSNGRTLSRDGNIDRTQATREARVQGCGNILDAQPETAHASPEWRM